MAHIRVTRLAIVAGLLAAAAALQGCSSTREAFGLARNKPDEFAVVTRAPLTLPPDYGLRPPEPGAQRPQETATPDATRNLLIGKSTDAPAKPKKPPTGLTPGEHALLAQAGALTASDDVRAQVDQESAALADARMDFIEWMMFWKKLPPPGVVVDPAKESRRIRETVALGESPAKGRTPIIERKEQGLIQRIFN